MKKHGVHEAGKRHGGHGGAWRTAAALIGLALLVAAGAAAAKGQVYKWKDAKGEVHYSDTPPPPGAQALKTPDQAQPDSQPDSQDALPYELARAVRLYPVTLYTTTAAPCDACEQGRSLLRARGIPYTEKTVATLNDQQAQRRLTGKDDLPMLVVGSRQLAGFQAAGWQEALDSASYPKQSMLPPGYRHAPTQAAAPVRARIKVPPDAAASTTPSNF